MSMSRPSDLLLDTHIWVRYLNGDTTLPATIVNLVETRRSSGHAFVSVISIWEIALLHEKGRLSLPSTVSAWAERALQLPGIQLLPFSPAIAIESVRLPKPMHKDPADRILVASARVEALELVTLDKAVLFFARETNLPHFTA